MPIHRNAIDGVAAVVKCWEISEEFITLSRNYMNIVKSLYDHRWRLSGFIRLNIEQPLHHFRGARHLGRSNHDEKELIKKKGMPYTLNIFSPGFTELTASPFTVVTPSAVDYEVNTN